MTGAVCAHHPAEACLRCRIYRLQATVAAVKVCQVCGQSRRVQDFPGYAAPVCRACISRPAALLAERQRKGLPMTCPQCGNPYTVETVYVHPRDRREVECRPCRNARAATWHRARKLREFRALVAEMGRAA